MKHLIYQSMSSNFGNIAAHISELAQHLNKDIVYITTNVPYSGEKEVQQQLSARQTILAEAAQGSIKSYNGCHNLTSLLANMAERDSVLVLDSLNLFVSNLWLGSNSPPNTTMLEALRVELGLLMYELNQREGESFILTNSVEEGFDFKTHDIKQYSDLITYANAYMGERDDLQQYISSTHLFKVEPCKLQKS